MIQHTVVFRLNHPRGSSEEAEFLDRAAELGRLPGVLEFRVLRQISSKSDYDHGLSMYFMTQQAYDAYDAHPDHRKFVDDIWLPEVASFMELDFVEPAV